MSTFRKIAYVDLREEIRKKKLQPALGRSEEKERLTRAIGRRLNNNALIIGPHGVGKTALVYGWLEALALQSRYEQLHLFQFDAEDVASFDIESDEAERFRLELKKIPSAIIVIDNFGRSVHNNPLLMQLLLNVYEPLLKGATVRFVCTIESQEYAWLERTYPAFVQLFERIHLKSPTTSDTVGILRKSVARLNELHRVVVPTDELETIVSYAERFPSLGQLPQSAIGLLDESISHAGSRGHKALHVDDVAHVVAAKTGVPKTQLNHNELEMLKQLETSMNEHIVRQEAAMKKIALTLQRAKLGLRNPNRPLGSFLLLGPSGVGKTETAKFIAEIMFGRSERFIRFDMSEFQQDHTVQRLIGAPAGYVGYEDGGVLTNALRKDPHSLILLDEIEKAHPKIFDLFLQVLDDGRLTSGQNETVDARNAIIMATSNVAVDEILQAYSKEGKALDDAFVHETIVPLLTRTFRPEFVNRFDAILVFNPLDVSGLMEIAQLEIKKIEKRFAKHEVHFQIDPLELEERVKALADPRFGARPVKRFVEETCETLLMDTLLNHA